MVELKHGDHGGEQGRVWGELVMFMWEGVEYEYRCAECEYDEEHELRWELRVICLSKGEH